MTSVLRITGQTPSQTIFNEDAADVLPSARLEAYMTSIGAQRIGNIYLLDMDDSDFGNAMYDMFDGETFGTDYHTTLADLGKKVFIGMPSGTGSELAGESKIVTLNLVKVLQGMNRGVVGYVVTAANITDVINDNAVGYLDVDVGRGAQ